MNRRSTLLALVAELRDATYAQNGELLCEYDPQQPVPP